MKTALATDIELESVANAYDRWAPIYDLTFGAVFRRGRSASIAAAERIGGRILEVGVGTGISLPEYSAKNTIFGVDISESMLRKARKRVTELGLRNVEGLAVMDAEHLDFPDASFDVIVAQYVITAVPNPEATLDEFVRVLKPGGEIVLVSRIGAEAGPAPQHRAHAPAGRAPARMAHRILLRALPALGRGSARHAPGRAPRHAAARTFQPDPLRQGRSRRKRGPARPDAAACVTKFNCHPPVIESQ